MVFDVTSVHTTLPPVDTTTRMPRQEYEEHVERLRKELRRRSIDVGIAFGTELSPGDTGWLTGYDPQLESTIVLVSDRKVLILGGPEGMAYAFGAAGQYSSPDTGKHQRRGCRRKQQTAREYLKPLALSPLYSLIHGIGWTEAMEGKGTATQHSDWVFHEGTSFMVDLGIFGQRFEDIPAAQVGLRLEDPYMIDFEGRTVRMTDLPLLVPV